MKIHRITSILLAFALQLMPLCRSCLVHLAPGGTAAMAIIRSLLGASVLMGECHAVSGASTAITSPLNVRGTNGVSFSYRITSSPEVANRYAAAPLPPGLTVSTNTGYITGVPSATGTWSVSLTASDRGLVDRTATATLTLKILDGAPTNAAPWIITQPQNQSVAAGSNAIFYVSAGGPAPLSYQWRFGNVDLQGRTSPLLPLNAVMPEQAGSYYVVVTNSAGAVTSAVAALTVSTNALRPPVPLLTLVTNGAGAILPSVSLKLLKPGAACALTAVPAPGQGFNGWSGSVIATSPVVRLTLTSNLAMQANFFPLNVHTNGSGRITPDLARAQNLVVGRGYSATAIPAAGQVFAGWTGSLNSLNPTIRFVLTPTLALQANFIPSPYVPVAGYYSGLFFDSNQVHQSSSGRCVLWVTPRGTYSGSLQIGAALYPIQGHLDLQLQATNLISRPNDPMTLRFQLGSGDQADQVNGTLEGAGWTAALAGDRATFNPVTHPCPASGAYTLLLPGRDDMPEWPIGDGYARLRVTASGQVVCAGTLADGTKFAQTATLSKQGAWPCYVSLYGGQGSLVSWLWFVDQPLDDLHGAVSWIKPGNAQARYYAGGFSAESMAIGSRYVAPVGASNSILNFTNGLLSLVGGNLSSSFTNSVVFQPGSHVVNLSSNRCSINFTLGTGEFTGNAQVPTTGKLLPFGGVVLQKAGYASGSFLGTNLSGRVNLRSQTSL